jgi:cellulose synthase/poly-beta-1,6-N-acetylglucosamine synthase-like glycosyltransferase
MRSILHWINQHTGWFFLAGFIAVLLRQWILWQQDKQRIARIEATPPLPSLATWPHQPKVSVLVAAWNEADNIQAHIQSFLALRYPHKELVLIAGGRDGTFDLAQKYIGEQVIVIQQIPGEGKQSALHKGLENTAGEIIYLTDADCLLSNHTFESILAPIANGEAVATTGRYCPLPEQENQPFIQMQWCIDNYGRAQMPTDVKGLIGRNAALTRSLLFSTGDFRKEAPIGTDFFLAQQILAIGKTILYIHGSMVATKFHSHPGFYIQQQSRWLRNILIYTRKFKSQQQYKAALGQCLSGLLVLSVILLSPFSAFFLRIAGLLVMYGTLARWRYLDFGKKTLNIHIKKTSFIIAPASLLIDQVMLVYTLFTMLSRTLRKRW